MDSPTQQIIAGDYTFDYYEGKRIVITCSYPPQFSGDGEYYSTKSISLFILTGIEIEIGFAYSVDGVEKHTCTIIISYGENNQYKMTIPNKEDALKVYSLLNKFLVEE